MENILRWKKSEGAFESKTLKPYSVLVFCDITGSEWMWRVSRPDVAVYVRMGFGFKTKQKALKAAQSWAKAFTLNEAWALFEYRGTK